LFVFVSTTNSISLRRPPRLHMLLLLLLLLLRFNSRVWGVDERLVGVEDCFH
jgi:hypothetical protein